MKRTSFFAMLLLGTALAVAGAAPDARTALPSPTATSSAAAMPSFPDASPGARITPEGWFAVKKESEQSRLPGRPSHVFIIPINGDLSKDTFETVNRSVKQATESHADLIVFDMDTWGGELLPALDISQRIHALSNDIYTVAYVRTRAISGGAMIALSCNEIVMTPTGVLGDIDVVSAVGPLARESVEREKVESVIRSQLSASAYMNGYSTSLSRAMATQSSEARLIRNKQTRELQIVLAEELPDRRGLTAQWELVGVVKPADRVLTLNAKEAVAFGLCSKVLDQSGTDSYSGLMQAFHAEGQPTVLANVAARATSAPATLPSFPDAPAGAKITQDGWLAPLGKLEKLLPPEHPSRVFIIPIREEITQKTWDVLQRKVARCRQSGADMIIFDMDTWGGLLMSGLDINRFLKANLNDIYTVCYVRTRAISAGAMIAMACNEIVITPVCQFGDCAPISGGGGTIEGVEREKLETVIRNEFRESARINGYSSALSQATVSASTEVWLIRHKQTAQLQYVLAEEWRGRIDAPNGATTMPTDSAAQWKLIQVVKPQGRLLTMNGTEAITYGFATKQVTPGRDNPYDVVLAAYGAKNPPIVLEDTWSEVLVEFLTSSAVTSVLMLIGILGIYLEFQTPGHIVPGVVGGLCFAIVFGSRFLLGMSDWWPIALFALGIGLILLEVLVFTGHMVWAISGILMCFVALGALFLPNTPGHLPAMPSTPLDWSVFTNGLLSIGVAFVLGIIAMIVATSYLQRLPIAGKLVLPQLAISDKPPVMSTSPLLRIRAGDQGVVHSMCRPVGKVRFGNDIVDAASEGEVLTAGQKVRVLRNDGNRIIIEKI